MLGWVGSLPLVLAKVAYVHDKYGLPIWVTEFAVADWSATPSRPSRYTGMEIRSFMRAAVAGMRAMPFVERFAWKTRTHTHIFGPFGANFWPKVLSKCLLQGLIGPNTLENCGAKGIRTPDLFDANEALYQLSYSPEATPVLEERRCRCP
jgi:hypothetical protein